MLKSLYIKNFILIDSINLQFNPGFSVFTGETGAGKSIFIDGISLLTGSKVSASMIKQGADKAIIEGEFSVNETVREKLDQAGYDNETLIITREINSDGKSSTRVNQRAASLSFIKELLADYVDIHCQHDNQYLLNDKYHLDLLDKYCNNYDLLQQVNTLYKEYKELENQYNQLNSSIYSLAQLEVIKYQLDELENAQLTSSDEEEKIANQLREFAAIEKNQKLIDQLYDLFEGDNGILAQLFSFNKIADNLSGFESIKAEITNLVDCYYTINDDFESIKDKMQAVHIDENTLNELNERQFLIQRLKRKYNTTLQGLIELKQQLNQQLQQYDNREVILDELNKQIKQAKDKYLQKANQLHQIRVEKSGELANKVMEQLYDLSLPNAQFKVNITEDQLTNKGIDKVEFLVSMNKGIGLSPLNKVASGGELSRLMLGLKVIFAALQGSQLVIFDEIDTGVSGQVAFNIGVKMAQLAKNIQVFAVTHLSSVCACGQYHYLISKNSNDFTTTSNIELLNKQQRINQIAMLSSSAITDSSLSAAEELLTKGQNICW
ncbi:MAG: DNA repair protein RecN [Erysipelotrichaceae bacterium]